MGVSEQEIINSLCFIELGYKNGSRAQGCGVFISPKRIITAHHVISGATSVKVSNPDGIHTHMKRKRDGGRHIVNEKLDIAIIELAAPIAKDFAFAANNHSEPNMFNFQDFTTRGSKGIIGTMFGRKAALHTLTMDPLLQLAEASRGKDLVNFYCDTRVGPGWSGSPIFAADGFRLISVVAAHQPSIQDKAEELNRVFQVKTKAIPLLGPHPQKYGTWVEQAQQQLGLR